MNIFTRTSTVLPHSQAESGFTSAYKWCSKALWAFNCSLIVLYMFDNLRDGVVLQALRFIGVSPQICVQGRWNLSGCVQKRSRGPWHEGGWSIVGIVEKEQNQPGQWMGKWLQHCLVSGYLTGLWLLVFSERFGLERGCVKVYTSLKIPRTVMFSGWPGLYSRLNCMLGQQQSGGCGMFLALWRRSGQNEVPHDYGVLNKEYCINSYSNSTYFKVHCGLERKILQ